MAAPEHAEHSVANTYFIPFGILVSNDGSWLASHGSQLDLSCLT
jgi:hypothetical protein